jgi:hypothetical protein
MAERLRWVVPILCVAFLLMVAFALHTRAAVATASSTTTIATMVLTADNLLDGSTATFWVSDTLPAHVDVRFAAREIEWIEVTNGDNAPHRNVSTRDFRVELFEGEARRWAATGSFPEMSTDVARFETPGVHADRLRVTVTSHHGPGHGGRPSACLSEISWSGR